ncbi:hypothetical protein BKA70DRAFT_1442893 [Coprinopsis sp. MPI-PUGE-AT-0042]|nr:hypothetical protein BKA70DRAFT_1442893 [Coprinopsis sp. MPI-PUGE-AT-0042]
MRFFLADDLARLFLQGINTQENESSEPVLPFGDSFKYVITCQCPRRSLGLQSEEHPIPPSQVENAAAAGFTTATTLMTAFLRLQCTIRPCRLHLIADRHSQALKRMAKAA